MRLLQDRQVAQRFRTERLELWEIGSGFVSGAADGEVVKLIGSYHPGCGRAAIVHNQLPVAPRKVWKQHPPSQKLTTWRVRCAPGAFVDCALSNRPRVGCSLPVRTRGPI